MVSIRLICLFSFVSTLLLSCHSGKSIISLDKKYACQAFQVRKMDACDILHILSDSAKIRDDITNQKCFSDLIAKLAAKSQIRPQWFCDFSGCYYFSLSLDKSIFKLDLLRWMQFFKCADTTVLKAATKGVFTKEEINFMKIRERQGSKIDTTILSFQ